MKICIVQPRRSAVTETFIRAHAERLPASVTVVHNERGVLPKIGDRFVLSQSVVMRAWRKAKRIVTRRGWDWEMTVGFLHAFRGVDAVLAEYGPMAVMVADACSMTGIPLVAHFHGYDASRRDIVEGFKDRYLRMFRDASAIVAVSKAMHRRLLELGAPEEKTYVNVYGADCDRFSPGDVAQSNPSLLAVGRFVEKKAPYLTLLAFAKAFRQEPAARLRMIGEGPLLGPCRDLARVLGVDDAVTFLGAQPHDTVAQEMRSARAFVQHSIQSSDGDCEGTPVAVLEASASGLPVVATRHGGIPDVVVEGKTGLLVEERDVAGMAVSILRLLRDREFASRLGQSGREHILENHTMDRAISRLWSIISSCIRGRGARKELRRN